jgi:hypothetical protein
VVANLGSSHANRRNWTIARRLCHVNLNWPREVSTTQFEFMRLSPRPTYGRLPHGRHGACGER